MKLEEITPKNLKNIDDKELMNVWLRLNEWYNNAIKEKHAVENIINAGLWTKKEFLSRNFKIDESLPLSQAIERYERKIREKTVYGEPSSLPNFISDKLEKLPNEILLIRDFAMIGGSAAVTENPQDIDLILRTNYDPIRDLYTIDAQLLNVALRRFFDDKKTGLHIVPSPQGSFTDYIPVYDLICRKRNSYIERIEPSPPNYDGKNRVIKRELKPFSLFIPPKPIVPMFTEFFDIEEIWNNWAKDRMPIVIEPKLNGFRAIIEKNNANIRLWFEGKREDNQLKKKIYSDILGILKNIPDDFIVDCDVGIKHAGRRLPRNETVILNANEPILDKSDTINITVFDLPFWKKDLHEMPFEERRARLEEFYNMYLVGKAQKLFEIVPSETAKDKEELKKLAKWAFSYPMSEGLMAKTKTGIYELDGTTNEWSKLKHDVEIKAIVLQKKITKGGAYVYTGGVLPSPDYEGENLFELKGKTYVNLGDSFSTKISASIGDIITVKIEELIPHINEKTNKEEIAWYAPRVIDKDDTRKEPYYINQIIDIAKRGGVWQSIKKSDALILASLGIFKITPEEEMGETRGGLAIRNWEKNWYKLLPSKNKLQFAYQHHWRGLTKEETELNENSLLKTNHSIHGDLRFESDDALWGFTIFLGTTKDVVKANGDRLMNLPFADALQVTPKLAQPKDWLKVGHNSPLIVEPHEGGATLLTYAKFFEFDSGTYEIGYAEQHFVEVFINGNKIKGRYTFQFAPVGEKRIWLIRRQEDETPFVERENLEKQFLDQKEKNRTHIYVSKPSMNPTLVPLKTTNIEEFKKLINNYIKTNKYIKIINKSLEKKIILGEVLIPDEIDAHGDIVSKEEIEEAAHKYLVESRIVGLQHKGIAPAEVIESYVAPSDFLINNNKVKAGTWLVAVKIHDDELWNKIKNGEYQSFSFGGYANIS